jgi:hypothetical protein
MPKCKNYLISIAKFYKFQTFDHLMFGYIQGLRKALPGMTITEALRIFLDSFEIDEDEYCFETAKHTYYRLLSSIIEPIERGTKTDPEQIL